LETRIGKQIDGHHKSRVTDEFDGTARFARALWGPQDQLLVPLRGISAQVGISLQGVVSLELGNHFRANIPLRK
jgi:hypothetical protein